MVLLWASIDGRMFEVAGFQKEFLQGKGNIYIVCVKYCLYTSSTVILTWQIQ